MLPPSACGKVILFGEHAVVYGRPALAFGLSGSVEAMKLEATAGLLKVLVPAWKLAADDGQDSLAGRALGRLRELLPGPGGMEATLEARIPTGAGLGSSAALSVMAVRCLAAVRGEALGAARERSCAHELERIFHGSPSGLDDTVAAHGGLCLFRRGGFGACLPYEHTVLSPQAVQLDLSVPPLLIGDTGQTRSTFEMVARVRSRIERDRRGTEVLFDQIEASLEEGLRGLSRGELERVGAAMDRNQEALAGLGVSCGAIEAMCALGRKAGALGVKLTGAGGGGAVVALAPGREEAVAEAWRAGGFTPLGLPEHCTPRRNLHER